VLLSLGPQVVVDRVAERARISGRWQDPAVVSDRVGREQIAITEMISSALIGNTITVDASRQLSQVVSEVVERLSAI
jgi:hypothetical protein